VRQLPAKSWPRVAVSRLQGVSAGREGILTMKAFILYRDGVINVGSSINKKKEFILIAGVTEVKYGICENVCEKSSNQWS
jgi:hypothetical protein